MSLITILKPDFTFEDDRGRLIQLVRRGFSQVNVIYSKKDSVRGKHYHKLNSEAFFVISGIFELTVNINDKIEYYTFKEGDMFLIPPLIIHSFRYLEDTCLVSMYSLGVEIDFINGTKDTYIE